MIQSPKRAASYEVALERDRRLLLHSWTRDEVYVPEVVSHASGNHFWTADGRRILDFRSQAFYANVGHGQPRVIEAIAEQARRCGGIYGYATEPKLRLAERILGLLPTGYERVYFGLNGADGIELALKVARMITGRQNVLAFHGGYHGASVATSSVSGEPRSRLGAGEPVPGTVFVPPPYHYRCRFGGATPEETEERTVDFLRATIEGVGPQTFAALVAEPYVTAGPGVIPSAGYWRAVEALCREHGIVLIADEMLTGFGRSGAWFARDVYGYEPDIVCMGKGLSSGYAPISATAYRGWVVDALEAHDLPYGLTYAGHPLACAAALAVIDLIEDEGLIERGREMGEHLAAQLRRLQDEHPVVGDVRCIGLFANLELVRDRDSREPFPADASLERGRRGPGIGPLIERRLWDAGVLIRAIPAILKFGPPLTIEREEIDLVVELLDGLLAEVDALR